MNRYFIKFSKEGYMKYISHLDLMRLYDRSLKRAGIQLAYSQGFNPHPKMSIAQPLSLGFESCGDYIEIETVIEMDPMEIARKLNNILPDDIKVLKSGKAPDGIKTLASLVEFGRYEADVFIGDQSRSITSDEFLELHEINAVKFQKKTGKESIVNIRPLIYSLDCTISQGKLMLDMIINTGSTSNLNPEILVSSFLQYFGISEEKFQYNIKRKDLYVLKDGVLLSLDSFIV